jgi:NTE family protein
MTSVNSASSSPIDLALQGGGSHGAFTWGVLDYLLEEGSLDFSAVSGTSAGALNAAVMLTGYASSGRKGARNAMSEFWRDISLSGSIFNPFAMATNSLGPAFNVESMPGYQWASSFFRSFSPYEFNPLDLNPLRDVVRRHVDEKALQTAKIPLFVTATNIRTGQAKVFTGTTLTLDSLMASTCLPFVFQAVEIDGESYWDGGYTGNPAIFPLIYDSNALDILLIRINPLERPEMPTRNMDILDRLSEITFNASLISEMRAISFVLRLLREHKIDSKRYKSLRMHMIADDVGISPLSVRSKTNTEWAFLEGLFHLGRQAALRWLNDHRKDVGMRSSFDIDSEFLNRP